VNALLAKAKHPTLEPDNFWPESENGIALAISCVFTLRTFTLRTFNWSLDGKAKLLALLRSSRRKLAAAHP